MIVSARCTTSTRSGTRAHIKERGDRARFHGGRRCGKLSASRCVSISFFRWLIVIELERKIFIDRLDWRKVI